MLATLYAVQISTRTLDSQLSAFYKLRFISLKKKKKGEGFSEKNFSLANLIVYRYRTNTNTDKIYPIRKIYNFKNIRTIKKLIK